MTSIEYMKFLAFNIAAAFLAIILLFIAVPIICKICCYITGMSFPGSEEDDRYTELYNESIEWMIKNRGRRHK